MRVGLISDLHGTSWPFGRCWTSVDRIVCLGDVATLGPAQGGPPGILAHAEYAIVEGVRGSVAVTLCRLPLNAQRCLLLWKAATTRCGAT
jgi:hypothetical protein